MKLYLTEKPSQAKILKGIVGNDEVVSLEGHILKTEGLDFYYDGAKWHEIYAQIKQEIKIPPEFVKKPQSGKLLSGRTAKDILQKIKTSASKADEIILATDPDDEGVVLGLEVLEYLGIEKKLSGMVLMNALEEQALKAALKNIQSVNDFILPMYKSGLFRSYTDWLLGMNGTILATIAFSKKLDGQTLHLGGVKTPVLRMIVKRDLAFEENKRVPFWNLKAKTGEIDVTFKHQETDKFYTKPQEAFENLTKIERIKITSDKTAQKEQKAKLPYSLSDLQTELAQKHKLDPSVVLETCQKLYMDGFMSYPRTDLSYYSDEFLSESDEILNNLKTLFSFTKQIKKPLCFNSKKLDGEAHTALAPTANIPKDLSGNAKIVYEYVCRRFIVQFLNPHKFNERTILVAQDDFSAKITLKDTTDLGFLEFLGKEPLKSKTPKMEDDFLLLDKHELKQGEDKPQPRFTKATLLKAMENINKHFEGVKLERGIGTQATRANAIADLEKKQYFVIEKDKIISTKKARDLIALLPNELSSPVLRTELEEKMKDIKKGKETRDLQELLADYKVFLEQEFKKIVEQEEINVPTKKTIGLKCPVCNEEIIDSGASFKCSANKWDHKAKKQTGCKFIIFKDVKPLKTKLTSQTFQKLLTDKQVSFAKGTLVLDLENKFFTKINFKGKK